MANVYLTAKQEKEIVRLYGTGKYTVKQLAIKFGCSKSAAWRRIDMARKNGDLVSKPKKDEEFEIETKELFGKRKQATEKLIEAMSDYAMVYGLKDEVIVERLFNCGLTLTDFVLCGYGKFAKDCLKGA